MDSKKTICIIAGILAVTAIGFLVIPPLVNKYSNKIYKATTSKKEIDFENLGPEIVKKN